MERLREGWTTAVNPFDRRQERRVSLRPEDADALVFWTRDPRPMLPYLDELEARGYVFYFMSTVTGYPAELEPGGPGGEEGAAALRSLSERIGRSRCIWRYDPIFLSSLTDGEFHRRNFTRLAELLRGAAFRVVLSCYDEYAASRRRLEALGRRTGLAVLPMRAASVASAAGRGRPRLLPEVRELLRDLGRIAAEAGLEARTCAEGEDAAELGMEPNACVDGELVAALRGGAGAYPRDRNQRPHCRCAASVDIGTYGLCPAGCVYCYARR